MGKYKATLCVIRPPGKCPVVVVIALRVEEIHAWLTWWLGIPGHHSVSVGFHHSLGHCYLNNVAMAALYANQLGFKVIAIVDFDLHYGNGTKEVLACANKKAGRIIYWYFSVHGKTYPIRKWRGTPG